MNTCKKYQYYILLEINNGTLNEHRVLKYADEVNYKREIIKYFYKEILNIAEKEQIGIINICEGKYEGNGKYLGNRISNYFNRYNRFISNLIATECDNLNIVNDDIFIPNEEFNDNEEFFINNGLKKLNSERKRLAIYHYLFNKEDKYISDFSITNQIDSFYYKYLTSHKLTYNLLEYKDWNTQTQELISAINNICLQSPIRTFFLSTIGNFRKQDLYCNYGLGEFEGGYDGGYNWEQDCNEWIYPGIDEIQSRWAVEEIKWNEKYINNLQKISQEESRRFFLTASFDYPINNLQIVYNPL